MDMDFKPNSHKVHEEQKQKNTSDIEKKRVDKVVSGKVKTRKKSEIRKFTDVFLAEDVANVKEYIIDDVVIPLVKKTVCDLFRDIPEMIFYGKRGSGRGSSRADRVSFTDYSRRDYRRGESRSRSGLDYDDLVFETRGEAERVLDAMDELIGSYGMVRVADMYDLAGETSPYTANDYGWLNIRNAEIVRVREGYIIRMPRAVPIK